MRWSLVIVRAVIVAIALYFVLAWGADAVRAFTSPNFELDDPSSAAAVRGLGAMLVLGAGDVVRLAAFVAAFKLAGAAVFAIHIAGRLRGAGNGTLNRELLEGALLLVVILIAALGLPALKDGNAVLIRQLSVDLLAAGTAAILTVVERLAAARA